MKVRDVIKQFEENGWVLARTRGDHRQRNLVTVSGHPSDDVTPGQLSDIRRDSRLPLR